MVDIPNISDKEVEKIEHEIDMAGERHVFSPGERIKIVKDIHFCAGTSSDSQKCNLAGKFGTVLLIFSRTQDEKKLAVVLDDFDLCDNKTRNTCLIDESQVESQRERVAFTLHQVKENGICESISCGKQSRFVVFVYEKGISFRVCTTHMIGWLNLQYRQMADVVAALNKQLRIKK